MFDGKELHEILAHALPLIGGVRNKRTPPILIHDFIEAGTSVMKTTDNPDTDKTHENGEKKKAIRKKFELLRFGVIFI